MDNYKQRIQAQSEAETELAITYTKEIERKEAIKKELLEAFETGSGEIQERAILKAFRQVGEIENEAGMFSGVLIDLKDFLLDYLK
jgi:hypothetical protein